MSPFRAVSLRQACLFAEMFLFFGLAALPLALNLAGRDGASASTELRDPLACPRRPRTWEAACRWPGRFERFVNDHFGGRPQLVKLNSLARWALGASGSPEVLVGSDEWLFLARDHDAHDRCRGLVRFSPPQLEQWVAEYKRRHAWLRKHGVSLVFAIVPEKQSVYGEFVPRRFFRAEPTLTDQLVERLRREDVGVVLDLRETMRSAKSSAVLYRRYDTHWNDRGALLACREIERALLGEGIAFHAMEPDALAVTTVRSSGDLARLLGLQEYLLEDWEAARLRESVVTRETGAKHWTTGKEVLTSRKGCAAAVLYGDSFLLGSVMKPYLESGFSRANVLHHRGTMRFEPALIADRKPDVVIYVVVERLLPLELDVCSGV